MRSLYSFLVEIIKIYQNQGARNSRDEAEELLSVLLNKPRSVFYSTESLYITDEQEKTALEWIERRRLGEPLAYLAGKVEFYGCEIEVNSSVLIPRPETEVLVDKIASTLKGVDLAGKTLWDVCSGSGCIGIALKKAFPMLHVVLSDCSEKALQMACSNAFRNQVEVECRLGELFEPFKGLKTHYFVCNPPYISEEEYETLESGVKDYEPVLALVSGVTGLEVYKKVADELPQHLCSGGLGWLEIGYNQGNAVKRLFEASLWKKRVVEKDWAGHDRFFLLEIE